MDKITLLLNGFEYPNETNTGAPIYEVMPPTNIHKHNIRNSKTALFNCVPAKIEII